MSKKVDEFFDLQDVIGNALSSIGGDMDDITGDIAVNGDEDVFTMSLYSTVDKKNARNFKRKFFDTIEKALSSTRFNDVSRDENYTFAYQLSENDLSNNIGPRAAKEFKDKFAMFEILITAYADREALNESGKSVRVPAPYNKYFEVSDYQPEPEDYQIGELIDGYNAHLLAYLEVKQEYIEETDIQPVLIDDKDYPVVEIVGGRLIPVNLNAVFVNDDDVEALEEAYEFSDDDFEDDIMHANVYGGDSKYCRECGTVKKYDEDGFAYCPWCQEHTDDPQDLKTLEESINETYWIDNKEVMDKVHSLQDELEADGWTQNGDRYTGSKYYSFYMKRGADKAIWKAIRYSYTDEPEIIDVTYRQVMGDHSLDSIDELRKSLGKMLLPKRESVQEDWDDLESIYDAYDAYLEDCSWKQITPMSFKEFKKAYLGPNYLEENIEDDEGKMVSVSFDVNVPSDMKDSEIENVLRKALAATDLDIPGYMDVHVLNEYLQEKLTGYKITISKDGKTFDDYACAYEEEGAIRQMKNKYGKDIEIVTVDDSRVIKESLTVKDSEELKAFLTSLLDDNVFEQLSDTDRKYAEAQTRKFLDKLKETLNESPRGFYVTTYYPDSRWSPEEGGTMDYGWQADKSKFFRSEQEAREYLDNQLVGMEIKTKYDGSYQYEDEYGNLQMIAIEPSGKRGRWHSPARSWAQIEFDDPVERPYFDRKGSRVDRNPRLVAKERKEAAALEKEFRDAVANATTKEELIEIATDAKFMHAFSKLGSILVDKFHELN